MKIPKSLILTALLGLSMTGLLAQEQKASDEEMKKALELLRKSETETVATNQSLQLKTPVQPEVSGEQMKQAVDMLRQAEAATTTNQPSAQPAAAAINLTPSEAVPTDEAGKEQRLNELLQMYLSDQISSAEYHRKRAELMQPPEGFRPVLRPPKPKVQPPTSVPSDVLKVLQTASSAGAAAVNATTAPALTAGNALEAGLVPGADFVVRVDFKSARRAPIFRTFKAMEENQPATGNLPGAELADMGKELTKKLGITEDDLESIVFSVDLDSIKMGPMGPDPESLNTVQGVLAVQLSKTLSAAQIKKALQDLAGAQSGADAIKIAEDKIGKTDVLVLSSEKESDPPIYVAAPGGKTLYLGLNQASVKGAIGRANGHPAELEGALAGVMNSIANDAQLKLGFVIPKALKDLLANFTKDAGTGPGAMLSSFKDIQSISLGVTLGRDMKLKLAGDLGNADAASGVSSLLSMLKPQFKAAVAQQTGKSAEQIPDNALTSSAQGSVLTISLTLDEGLLKAMNANKPKTNNATSPNKPKANNATSASKPRANNPRPQAPRRKAGPRGQKKR